MDKQKRFNEEVSNKVAIINILVEDLDQMIGDISSGLASDARPVEFRAIDARRKLEQIIKVLNEIHGKLDDRE